MLIAESSAVLLTGVGKIIFINIYDYRLVFIVFSCLLWLAYAVFKYIEPNKSKSVRGETSDIGFLPTMKELFPYVLGLIVVFCLFGIYTQRSVADYSIVFILMLYPIWGVLQQYLVLGIFGNNLKKIWGGKVPDYMIVLVTAVLFSVVHYPSLILIGATFFLAIVYMFLYLSGRNIIAMGVYHGWLAAFFFYFVLGRNPWLEAFG